VIEIFNTAHPYYIVPREELNGLIDTRIQRVTAKGTDPQLCFIGFIA